MVQRLEPGLFTLVKPSRLFKTSLSGYNITKNNWYCKPTREITIDNESFDWDGPLRFHAVNFSKAQDSDYNLFEVRMHHGTVDYLEIIPWISLWMHIFNSSRFSSNDTGFEGKLFARGNASIKQQQANKEDVFQLLENENITINNSLKATLLAKRTMMKILWENALPNRVDSWEDAGWYN